MTQPEHEKRIEELSSLAVTCLVNTIKDDEIPAFVKVPAATALLEHIREAVK